MSRPLPTVLVGAGRIGAGYADDAAMARHYRYATHAQVLAAHPAFEWGAVVEPAPDRRAAVTAKWGRPLAVGDAAELRGRYEPEVAVLAVHPEARLAALEALPSVRAVLVEKPLGRTTREALAFVQACERRGLQVQVNLWRRADPLLRALADGELSARIGTAQAAFGVYGNGLHNNGTHMVDLARMLLGEVEAVTALPPFRRLRAPDPEDVHVPFVLHHRSGVQTHLQPLDFAAYRENALDVWGTAGRLALWQEGLAVHHYPLAPNRAMQGEREVQSDAPKTLPSTVGEALYHVYDDLARALRDGTSPCAPAAEALRDAHLIDAVLASAAAGGARIAGED